ncbi:MAG: hypothetical protein WAZ12_05275 [Candidatus Absconditicoccaceae bacterium]
MKKKGIFLLLSPIFVLLLRLIISAVFWFISTLGIDAPLLIVIKTLINRILGILALISIPLLIIGIVLLSKNKDSKITSGEVIGYARKQSKKHMTRYLLGFLLLVSLQTLSSYIDGLNKINPDVIFDVLSVVITLLSRRLVLGLAKISLSIVYEQEHKISNLFQGFYKAIKYIIAYVLNIIIIICGFILLIIPGIIRSFKLSLVPYIILQDGLGPIQAIKKSWRMTKGFVGDIFIINLLAGLINILGLLALFVGLLWTIPLYMIANAYIYKRILEETGDQKIVKSKPTLLQSKSTKAIVKKPEKKKPIVKRSVKKVVKKTK